MVLDRPALKQQAKGLIAVAKPSVLVASAIYSAVSALLSYLSGRLVGIPYEVLERAMRFLSAGDVERAQAVLMSASPSLSARLIDLALQAVLLLLGVGFTIFILNTVRGSGAANGNLLDGFAFPVRIILLTLLRGLLVALWGLLLIVPGIIAAYRYSLALYVMIDHPEYGVVDCLRESRRITEGYKKDLFLLDLSFIGWIFLTSAPYVGYILAVWVTPYIAITRVFYYERLSGHISEARAL